MDSSEQCIGTCAGCYAVYAACTRRGNLVRAGECLLINEQHIFRSTMRHVRYTTPRVGCPDVDYVRSSTLLRSSTNERVPISHQPFLRAPPPAYARHTYVATFPTATLDVLFPIPAIDNWNRGITFLI